MKMFVCFPAVFIIFYSPALAQNDLNHETTDLPTKFSFSVTQIATLSCPNFKFGDNYSPYWGSGAKACLNMNFLGGNGGFDFGSRKRTYRRARHARGIIAHVGAVRGNLSATTAKKG